MNVAQPITRLPESVYAKRRAGVALALAGLAALIWVNVSTSSSAPTELVTVTVSNGESLWTLAEQFAPESQDPRDWIYTVRDINNLETSELYPGMQLTVPATK